MANTFGAKDILSTLGITATNWEIQSSSETTEHDGPECTRDNVGAYVADSAVGEFNDRTLYSVTLRCAVTTGGSVSFSLGGTGAAIVTDFSLKQTNTSHAEITINGVGREAAFTTAETAFSVSLTGLGFGVLVNYSTGTLAECQSVDLSGAIETHDAQKNNGEWLASAASGVTFDVTETYITDSAPNFASPWFLQSVSDPESSNTGFYTCTIKGRAYSLS